jgi:hypothetical protein
VLSLSCRCLAQLPGIAWIGVPGCPVRRRRASGLAAPGTISIMNGFQWIFRFAVLYSALKAVPLVWPLGAAGTADRFQREVTMETSIQGPILYLLIAWGILTAIFIVLLIWRSVLSSHEDDQIFLDAAEEHMAREQRELIAKITSLGKPIATTGIASGALFLLIAGMWVYNGIKQNF